MLMQQLLVVRGGREGSTRRGERCVGPGCLDVVLKLAYGGTGMLSRLDASSSTLARSFCVAAVSFRSSLVFSSSILPAGLDLLTLDLLAPAGSAGPAPTLGHRVPEQSRSGSVLCPASRPAHQAHRGPPACGAGGCRRSGSQTGYRPLPASPQEGGSSRQRDEHARGPLRSDWCAPASRRQRPVPASRGVPERLLLPAAHRNARGGRRRGRR